MFVNFNLTVDGEHVRQTFQFFAMNLEILMKKAHKATLTKQK